MSYIADENGKFEKLETPPAVIILIVHFNSTIPYSNTGFRPSGVHIPADGKAAIPLIADKDRQIIDPLLNRYDPFTARNRYNLNGKYNKLPYDPRYPYEAAKYNPLYNNARTGPYDPKYPYEAAKYNPLYNNPFISPIIGQGKIEPKKSA